MKAALKRMTQNNNNRIETDFGTQQSLTEGQLLTAIRAVVSLCLYVLLAVKLALPFTLSSTPCSVIEQQSTACMLSPRV